MDIDICCIAKNERLTIRDWVEYHLNMGFHKIWIYQNDGSKDKTIKDILSDYVESGRVCVMDDFADAVNFQLDAYNRFMIEHHDDMSYEWVGFIDCDEYFDYNHDMYDSIYGFFNEANCVCPGIGVLRVNWEMYGDNGQFYYDDKPVVERFPNPISFKVPFPYGDDSNIHVKSFARNDMIGRFFTTPHNCVVRGRYAYNSDFKMNDMESPFNKDFSYRHAKLKHYCTKSLQEYMIRKLNSRTADADCYPYDMDYYWQRNPKTDAAMMAYHGICVQLYGEQ